jgi:regulation of enolase protein 1 (concanavalin A-like superfamily)
MACAALAIALATGTADAQTGVSTGWVSQDIGGPVIHGVASGNGSSFTITAGGADIWGASDQFQFVYQRVSGDVDIRARVMTVSAAHAWSKAGVMIRATLDPSSAHAYMLSSAAKGVAFQRRSVAGALSQNTAGPAAAPPQWVRLVRVGSQVTAYTSADGSSWTPIGGDTIALGSAVYVGIAVTAHNEFGATTATVSNVSVLPVGQIARDIGSPALAGRTGYNSGLYTITAAGRDIWDTADQFHFVYQAVAGDVDVRARVLSIGYADQWSKAGVMIRQSLDPGSSQAFALASAARGFAFQRRSAANGASEHTAGPAWAPPGWVRLTRVGDVFTAYASIDGLSWQTIGSDSIPMTSAVYVGLAATSHNIAAYSTSRIDGYSAASGVSLPTASSATPKGVAFHVSADDATLVTSYRLDVFGATANPDTAAPIASLDVGKPAPDANGDVTVTVPDFFTALPAGTYELTVAAIGTGGIGRSSPLTFTR